MPRIPPKNPRIGGIQKRTARRGTVEMRWRGEVVIADAWVALRSPPITHQSRAGDPSGARARRPVRRSAALIRHGRHSRIHTYTMLLRTERKREKGRERYTGDDRACPRTCVRDSCVLSVTIPVLRERSSNVHTLVSCDSI